MHLGDIAKAADLQPSKAHRYLVSLCRSDIVEQDPVDGKYDLAGGAIELGLAAQNRLDEFKLGENSLRELHESTKRNAAIITWGDRGPTIVRRIDAMAPLIVSTRIGSSVSVLNSAAGRVFAAFLPSSVVGPAIELELQSNVKPKIDGREVSMGAFEKFLNQVRDKGFAEVHGDFLPGFDALSAPVFDSSGMVVMALGLLGPSGSFGNDRSGTRCRELLVSTAARLTLRLGGKQP